MRRIPNRVIVRNRNNAEADRNAQFYAEPAKTGGRCQLCGKPEHDHGLGLCDDLRGYVPPVEKCVVAGCEEMGAVRDRYYVCPAHLAQIQQARRIA